MPFGNRVDLINTTGHLEFLDQDYKALSPFNIGTVREGIRWSFVERSPYHYDWSVVESMIKKGATIWGPAGLGYLSFWFSG
jgi:hypothetical protein